MTIELPEDLIELERTAWAQVQTGTLTTETAAAVQAGVTAHAEAAGLNRHEVEMALKKAVRHAEAVA